MPVTNYDTLHGEIIAEYTDGVQLDYLKDALGSVTAWVDQNCNIVATARYKPFGDILVSTGTLGRFTWVGTLGYRSSGLTWADKYVRARHYGSKQDQWTTVDPLWPSEMPYGYVSGNPSTMSDPSGMAICRKGPCEGGGFYGACVAAFCSGNMAVGMLQDLLTVFKVSDVKDIIKLFKDKWGKETSPDDCCKKVKSGNPKPPRPPKDKGDVEWYIKLICSGLPKGNPCIINSGGDINKCKACCSDSFRKDSYADLSCQDRCDTYFGKR